MMNQPMMQQPEQPNLEQSAMQRRLQAQKADPMMVIHQSLEALMDAPEAVRKEYAPVLVRAQMNAEKMKAGG